MFGQTVLGAAFAFRRGLSSGITWNITYSQNDSGVLFGCLIEVSQAATEVYRELMASDTVASKTRGGRANGRPRVVGRTKTNAGKLEVTGGITTNLRDGWMASPLLGQALHPEALDRCPRGVLQVIYKLISRLYVKVGHHPEFGSTPVLQQ